MGDKFSNVLIVFIMIIIMGLGGMYYIKVVQNRDYPLGEAISYGEAFEEQETKTATTDVNVSNTLNNTGEERMTINNTSEPSNNSIYVNQNQGGYKYNNRYYYNSLDTYSKAIYDAFIKEYDNLKSGNATIPIDYDFRILLNSDSGEQELKIYYDDAVNALNLDIPNLFYIDFSKMWLQIEKKSNIFTTKYNLYINAGKNPNYFIDGFNSKEEVEFAINQVENIKNKVKANLIGSDYTKLIEAHDWIIENMEYDLGSSHRASVYGALVEKKGVCEAYARTYKYILDELGIGNVLITGTATNSNNETEEHMWNYVKLLDNWYAVDVTWDDPIIIGNGIITEDIKHRYFLLGSKELFKNHTEKETISQNGKVFTLPILMVNKY